MKCFVVFIAGALVFGAASLGVGYAISGADMLVEAATAFGLAFVPAAVTLGWVVYSCRANTEMRLLASLGGSGVRMVIALGGGLLLTRSQPETFQEPIWYWLAFFYLGLLAFEMTLIVRLQPDLNGPPQT